VSGIQFHESRYYGRNTANGNTRVVVASLLSSRNVDSLQTGNGTESIAAKEAVVYILYCRDGRRLQPSINPGMHNRGKSRSKTHKIPRCVMLLELGTPGDVNDTGAWTVSKSFSVIQCERIPIAILLFHIRMTYRETFRTERFTILCRTKEL
jgi:hypothetical protein